MSILSSLALLIAINLQTSFLTPAHGHVSVLPKGVARLGVDVMRIIFSKGIAFPFPWYGAI